MKHFSVLHSDAEMLDKGANVCPTLLEKVKILAKKFYNIGARNRLISS